MSLNIQIINLIFNDKIFNPHISKIDKILSKISRPRREYIRKLLDLKIKMKMKWVKESEFVKAQIKIKRLLSNNTFCSSSFFEAQIKGKKKLFFSDRDPASTLIEVFFISSCKNAKSKKYVRN
jgi:hypothetical protein